jgi:hypothetical protein
MTRVQNTIKKVETNAQALQIQVKNVSKQVSNQFAEALGNASKFMLANDIEEAIKSCNTTQQCLTELIETTSNAVTQITKDIQSG